MSEPKTNTEETVLMKATLREKWAAFRYFIVIMWRANRGLFAFRFVSLIFNGILQPLGIPFMSKGVRSIRIGNSF